MHKPKRGIFFDFHTMPACPDVGGNFDAQAIADQIESCGADYIVFHARCNLGMAYYDTKVGIRHPSLKFDLFGKLAEACCSRGIMIAAYINVGLSHEEALCHRDWAIVTPEGYVYQPNRLDHFFRGMCYNTPYAEHVLEMVRELVSGYPIGGLFLDCMRQPPCVGVECIREMKQRGIDWRDATQLQAFARTSRVRMAERIARTAKELNRELLLYFNGVDYEDQMPLADYYEYECLPTGGWGYENLPTYGRYLRTLGKPVVNMTGRFHESWADFGGIRPEAALEYDCLHGLALGMRTTIGDHFHPRGDINHEVFGLIRRVYTRTQKLDEWTSEEAKPLVDLAVVTDSPSSAAAKGAVRILSELKAQFDVVTPQSISWDGYRLLVLADNVQLDQRSAERIQSHLDKGGKIISSAWSGLNPAKTEFVLPNWGIRFLGDCAFDPAYLVVKSELAERMPNMPLTLYERGTAIAPTEQTMVLAEIVAPYYNRHWDGEHGFLYLPPDRATGQAALTQSAAVAHFTHPIFTTYFRHAPVPLRQLVGNLLQRILPRPLVKAINLPSFARAIGTAQTHRRMIHLLSYVPERRGANIDIVEEPIVLHDVKVGMRTDERTVKNVYLAPDRIPLDFNERDKYAWVTVPRMSGYAMIVFEMD